MPTLVPTLLAALALAAPAQDALVPLVVGETFEGVLEATDPVVTTARIASYMKPGTEPARAKAFLLRVPETGPYHVELHSHLFDGYLVLRGPDGEPLAEDASGWFGRHPRLALEELVAGVVYRVEACSWEGVPGPFTLACRPGAPPALSAAELAALELADARERARAVEAVAGGDSKALADAVLDLALLLRRRGDDAAARPLFERALEIQERALDPDHPDRAFAANELGLLLQRQGDDAGARPLLERALAIWERADPESSRTAAALNNLSALFQHRGDHAAAQPLAERALAIWERALGPEHPLTAMATHNLATLLRSRGDWAAARPLFERALAIDEQALGPEHPDTALTLNNLAGLLQDEGDLVAARALAARALAIREKALGPEHLDTASSLNNLAEIFREQGDLAAARPLYERALAIWEKVHGSEHRMVAAALNNLGLLLRAQGDDAAARPLSERALAILERALGPEHPDTLVALRNLAVLRERQGERAAARTLYERALAISRRINGAEHPATARLLNDLVLLSIDEGRSSEAWALLVGAGGAEGAHVRRTLASLSEGERYLYLAGLFGHLETRLSLARALAEPSARRTVYDAVLRWKGRVGRALAASRAQLTARMGEAERALVESLRTCQAELSRTALESEVRDREARARRLDQLGEERSRLERELYRLASSPDDRAATFEGVRAKLGEREALVDFLAHRVYRPGRGTGGGWSARRTSAWITRADLEVPIEIDLGPAEDLERAIEAFLEELVARRGAAAAAADGPDPGAALRALLWDPLAPHLAGIETVFVSPDGALGTLPFETLPLVDGERAIERHAFVYLQDVGDLLVEPGSGAGFGSLLSVGGVDFRKSEDWDADGAGPDAPELVALADAGLRGSFTDYWGSLPATEYESRVVLELHEDAFGAEGERLLLQGAAPSEERLKHELERHAVLHLATHGYFQPEGMPSMWEAAKAASGRTETRLSEEARRLVGKQPGLLSGLVCAGANRGGDPDGDDGYLTAEEVAWLDLSRAELVVLSACETGLGRPQSGEGLLGLRRAFETAGAKTVISSLWSVKDESTADLMRDFYANLWLRGLPRAEALRRAQLAMLRANRVERGADLPSTWGAFVLSGEWR